MRTTAALDGAVYDKSCKNSTMEVVFFGAKVNATLTDKTTEAVKDFCPGNMKVPSSPEMLEDVSKVTEGGADTKESNTGLTVYLAGKAVANKASLPGKEDAEMPDKSKETGAKPDACKALMDLYDNTDETADKVCKESGTQSPTSNRIGGSRHAHHTNDPSSHCRSFSGHGRHLRRT